jgi:hypothetical protein
MILSAALWEHRPGRDRHRGAASTPLPRQQARDLDCDQGRSQVPCYWLIAPEGQTLIAYRLLGCKYRVVFSVERRIEEVRNRVRIPPFEEVGIDLAYVFGEAD